MCPKIVVTPYRRAYDEQRVKAPLATEVFSASNSVRKRAVSSLRRTNPTLISEGSRNLPKTGRLPQEEGSIFCFSWQFLQQRYVSSSIPFMVIGRLLVRPPPRSTRIHLPQACHESSRGRPSPSSFFWRRRRQQANNRGV
jgi:hypothetical protein